MDLYSSVRSYFMKMLSECGSGMKVLVLDDDTLKILSVVLSFSEIMEKEVYLVERMKAVREPMRNLIGVFFLRPTNENIAALSQELHKPLHSSYHLYFSHALPKQSLKQLAEADDQEVVAEVYEYFADYLALSDTLFSVDFPISFSCNGDVSSVVLNRSTDAITSVALSLKLSPLIRYQSSSPAARKLAESVRSFISREASLFDFRRTESHPVILIVDRRQDPVTPLLSQWTYEAMLHELIGIKNNRVCLPNSSSLPESMRELILSREIDDFYKKNQYSNFGDIGQSVTRLLNSFQEKSKSLNPAAVTSITDLKEVLENYPAFKKASGTVEMHVTLISELSRIVKDRHLLEISEIEQDLVCQDNPSSSLSRIRSILSSSHINPRDAVRLCLLFALRFEKNRRDIVQLRDVLTRSGVSADLSLFDRIHTYAGQQLCVGSLDLLSTVKQAATNAGSNAAVSTATTAVASLTKKLVKGKKDVENIYTQHEPLLAKIVTELVKGQLRESEFPTLACSNISPDKVVSQRPRAVIIFIIGGATYEEALFVHRLNKAFPHTNILLGSTCMHNSTSFLEEVRIVTGVSSMSYEPAFQANGDSALQTVPVTTSHSKRGRSGYQPLHQE